MIELNYCSENIEQKPTTADTSAARGTKTGVGGPLSQKWMMPGLVIICLALSITPVRTNASPVDLELSLLVDVSGSISDSEFELQRQGYVDAFRSDALQSAIAGGAYRSIATNVIYWSGRSEQDIAVGWQEISDVATAEEFAQKIESARRSSSGVTAPGSAINYATAGLHNNGFDGTRQVFDVSGDGVENSGVNTATARNNALNGGVDAINGLVIGSNPSVRDFYERDVKGGNGSFTVSADTFDDFTAAVHDKIVRETVPYQINDMTLQPTTSPDSSGFKIYGLNSSGNVVPGTFDPTVPTVVVTHGWQRTTKKASLIDKNGNFKSTPAEFPLQDVVTSLRLQEQADNQQFNVITYQWADAYTGEQNPVFGYVLARSATDNAGATLARQLTDLLHGSGGGDYTQPLHFIGHSFGTLVNAQAINELNANSRPFDVKQATLLDPPLAGPGVSPSSYHSRLPQGSVEYVDNFYVPSILSEGFGGRISGAAPDGGQELELTHSGVHAFYANQVLGDDWISPVREQVFSHRPAPTEWDPPSLFVRIAKKVIKASNPAFGVAKELNEEGPALARGIKEVTHVYEGRVIYTAEVYNKAGKKVAEIGRKGWQKTKNAASSLAQKAADKVRDLNGYMLFEESPSAAAFDVSLPRDITGMSFDFMFPEPGDGDWLSLHFNDQLLWRFLGTNTFDHLSTANVSLADLAEENGSLFFTLNSTGLSNASAIFGNLSFYGSTVKKPSASVPEPAAPFAFALVLIGIMLLARRADWVGTERKGSSERGKTQLPEVLRFHRSYSWPDRSASKSMGL